MKSLFASLILMFSSGGVALGETCSVESFKEDRKWSNPSCSMVVDRPGAKPRPPLKSEVGADIWPVRFQRSLQLITAAVQTKDAQEWLRQRDELLSLSKQASSWPPGDFWLGAKSLCADAATSTLRWMDTITQGTARGVVAADDSIQAAKIAAAVCLARLEKMR